MELLGVNEEVIEGYILPFLDWNDLLRFRRACKETHRITTRYMQVHPELAPEIGISVGTGTEEDDGRSPRTFLEMYIPTTKIFLENGSAHGLYGVDEEGIIMWFLEKYGTLLSSLRVEQMPLLLEPKELAFLERLAALKHLTVGYQEDRGLSKATSRTVDAKCFKNLNLESLKIGQKPGIHLTNFFVTSMDVLKNCVGLNSAQLPFQVMGLMHSGVPPEHSTLPPQFALGFKAGIVLLHINIRRREFPDQPNLEEYDFACCHDKEVLGQVEGLARNASLPFLRLLVTCAEVGVKLWNVGSNWLFTRAYTREFSQPNLGVPIKSLINLHYSAVSLEMPNLVKLDIRSTSNCTMPAEEHWINERSSWALLNSLNIKVDCKKRVDQTPVGPFEFFTKDVFAFCFKDIQRMALTELRLCFVRDNVPVPNTEEIVESCPNLKKLTLVNWLGTNKALVKLWEGLPGLEEITLENCKTVGNVTFVGTDAENPVFLKLKNLKKLVLKGLDKMPKITDTLFSLVIRHLKLSHMIITSDAPIKSVTVTGIRSLLEGQFASAIEKFPFNNWSLASVSTAEFKKLETQFRSYEMI